MGKPIRLMIADDHVIMREGLKQIFALDDSLSVVAEAGNGAQVLAQLRSVTPDLLLLDMSMPGISGEALISRVVAQYPRLPILVLSMYSEAQIAQHALKSGARGYITKDKDPEALLSAIRRVAQGARYIDHTIAEQLVFSHYTEGDRAAHDVLTAREHQIMIMFAQGMGINAIANELAISNKTVSTHKARLMEKMQFSTNVEIVKYVVSKKLIP
ncbi:MULTISPECIES: response regulator transcription factor [Pectobacterium]|uniref:response regulator transcription factor n=1 Tax=Pectobacterium TaxID=122277 RepID=UPI001583BDFB|nr:MULTISPECIES: response regulator transcription factor [Pectobacterium]MBN3082897.1 response regulator transcription factor [Pectobacterium polaris]MCA6956243.1 response regulator transcription factor [Pectobacterium polaris]MCU1791806.1 DNA-binding response regulator [Pectobacterium polaris]MCU1797603.1 response regulator transcription factor [Pectobacterium polaris]MCY9847305.1 response regulator transcription factor [Pectobacterium jejuense]